MVDLDAGVDDVGACSSTCTVIVDIRCTTSGARRDAAQAPRDATLCHIPVEGDDGVLLNVFHLVMVSTGRVQPAAEKGAYDLPRAGS